MFHVNTGGLDRYNRIGEDWEWKRYVSVVMASVIVYF